MFVYRELWKPRSLDLRNPLSFSDLPLWLSLLIVDDKRNDSLPCWTHVLLIAVLVFLQFLPPASSLNDTHDNYCAPSCGNIPNISYPFRLKGDSPKCGDTRYELSCDENNHTLLSLHGSKYYVSQINYNNYTIRIVDAGIQEDNYSFIPRHFLNYRYFLKYLLLYTRDYVEYSYSTYVQKNSTRQRLREELSEVVVIVNCEKPIVLDSSFHFVSIPKNCSNINNGSGFASNSSLSQYSKRYTYLTIISAVYNWFGAMDVEESCTIEQMSLTSWPGQINEYPNISSCTDLRNVFSHGFELSWFYGSTLCGSCRSYHDCYLGDDDQAHCYAYKGYTFAAYLQVGLFYVAFPAFSIANWIVVISEIIGLLLEWRVAFTVLGTPFVIAFLIYKWRRRHLSAYNAVEEFLQSQNNLVPISYSYSEIKKMTKGFREKLGEGGYGTVFKGTLRSGYLVAVKMLGQSKTNGQDFINEVATIGRIHHVNVVQLIGYCVHGSKRALVYDFMPKGSLNKYIFSSEESMFLDNERTYNIALGVARGIEYLHRGCDMQILHFDIKPHNILLDGNFIPKVSDFGLAKLYPIEDNTIYLTAARGTLGYMAPELFYKNIGGISYKADIYSFGMLLMEMVGKRKNLNAFVEHSSQIYFPTWVYDQFNDGKDIEIECATEEEKEIVKKMIIVALWCIQMNPSNRPSMNKVLQMLEGEVEHLQIPSRPPLSSPERVIKNCEDNSSQVWLSSQTLSSTS
ncbi:LEAF RUST 10 DISEASE-RESISTANCE LOCUS RECEPTOR-LIKE PROTEIN KINASE-like 2.1 isoform X2 [Carya illinoinensis]|uniref:LEAF RUST 10 DISEASE-RESISTANCE LOCUS RECEPTOR-LIKE PROTEIN KINASE-like 2.1 isoform X2 n=1 Tax=Carya illinoinensis TaxID=32201 RepID=UPI001C71C8EE|nr:LEAF RUST 10 DISEASE-RESISTANCE LOCUS RECEPTOR-LIKE PROTEIN KINASE-like 2.1 isoform X2 [Carya illinoinensis]